MEDRSGDPSPLPILEPGRRHQAQHRVPARRKNVENDPSPERDLSAKTIRISQATPGIERPVRPMASFSSTITSINGFFVIKPEDLFWRPSNLMKIPNADFLERTKSEILGARLWRLPPRSANTLHRHPKMEEFYFVIEGVGRMRIGDQTITVPKHGGVLVGPEQLRQVFNDSSAEVLWLIVGAPEKEMESG